MKPLPYNISEADIEFGILLKERKNEFARTFTLNLDLQEKNLQKFRLSLEHCNSNNMSNSKPIWNAAGYISIISYDLKIIAKNLAFSESEWEKRYFARQVALLIYEGCHGLLDLLGKDFRGIIKLLPNSDDLRSELNALAKRLNEYKSTYRTRLNEIRNFSIAHRDSEVLAQLNVICSIEWVDAINFTSTFDKILNDAGRFMQKILPEGYF